eukprot:5973222-Prymnesium_polylepis.1
MKDSGDDGSERSACKVTVPSASSCALSVCSTTHGSTAAQTTSPPPDRGSSPIRAPASGSLRREKVRVSNSGIVRAAFAACGFGSRAGRYYSTGKASRSILRGRIVNDRSKMSTWPPTAEAAAEVMAQSCTIETQSPRSSTTRELRRAPSSWPT